MRVSVFLLIAMVCYSPTWAAEKPRNLALDGRTSASESLGDLTPEKAIDGKMETRWSGIPGHNQGVWFQIDWPKPIEIGEVIVHQYDRFVYEFDVQTRTDKTDAWRTVQHFGRPGERLPKVVPCRFKPAKVSGIRIGNITNGPSFTEVIVHQQPLADGLVTQLASDLRGHFIGVTTDSLGNTPIEGAEVTLSGYSKGGPWQTTVRSNDKGLFFAPMPLGLSEGLTARTTLRTAETVLPPTESSWSCSEFQYGLTPCGTTRSKTSLNGKWKFTPDPHQCFWRTEANPGDKMWAEITVPSHWEMESFHSEKGWGGYRRHFTVPDHPGRIKLRFEGVYSDATVWVNGHEVARHEGGATPFEVDVTDFVTPGDNLLALLVKEHSTTSDQLDHMSHYADFPLAGIFRPVYLLDVPPVHVGSLEITSSFDRAYRNAQLQVRVGVLNESSKAFQGEVELTLQGPSPGQAVVCRSKPIEVHIGPWQRLDREIVLPVEAPKSWDAEHPNLYTVSARLLSKDQVADSVTLRTGFRQTEIRGSEILVNGRPIKLRGTCHHDAHPLMGRAVTAEVERQDLMLMKEANLNSLRTSHYPPLPDLLDLADELGIYVEDEASFCWVSTANDLRLAPRILQLTAELLARDRNHPCVPFWSLCNESEFGYDFARSHEWVRMADPSRPTSAATSADLEIATLHNPISLARIDQHEKLRQPLLFDESLCIYQGIFNDVAEMWVDPGMRDYYAVPLPAIYERFMASKVTQGSMIWCWADDLFCVPGRGYEYGRGTTRSHFLEETYRVPGRGLVGDAPWGVVDGWRRPKPEFWITKKLHSPIKLTDSPLALPPASEPIRIPVENQYDFTNLAELQIHWTLGEAKGVVRADVPPRSRGVLEVRPPRIVKDGEILALSFEDRAGRLVDSYRLPLGRERSHEPTYEKSSGTTLSLREEDVLAGPCVTIVGKDFQLAVDRESGQLRRGVAGGYPLLLELPAPHLLPTHRPLQPLPDRLSWHLDKLDVRRDGDRVRLTIHGHYQHFQGGHEVTITPSGEITVASSFTYTGEEIRVREIGCRFSVPRDCDVLEWDRRALWSVYPPDHIGRPGGSARAFVGHARAVPPTWPWAEDDSPMGSNDFRSTKRAIFWAGLHYPAGPGILVQSQGRQHLRALVESDRISVHVNDFSGGTNVGWPEWTQNYGQGQMVRKGERITSQIHLRLALRFPPQ